MPVVPYVVSAVLVAKLADAMPRSVEKPTFVSIAARKDFHAARFRNVIRAPAVDAWMRRGVPTLVRTPLSFGCAEG